MEKQKNLKWLLKVISIVAKNIPKLKLTIVGKGSEKNDLIKLVKLLN